MKLTDGMIMDRCGGVSYKRGAAFFRADKVAFLAYGESYIEAEVYGTEVFHVTIRQDGEGSMVTACSCPSLASFQKDCQHVAAVLLACRDFRQTGTSPRLINKSGEDPWSLAEDVLSLFNSGVPAAGGRRSRFENRRELNVEFICTLTDHTGGSHEFAISIKAGDRQISALLPFLLSVKMGQRCVLFDSQIYDPERHCFDEASDSVITLLAQIAQDEAALLDHGKSGEEGTLIVPPSYLQKILELLKSAPHVKLKQGGMLYDRITFRDSRLPLLFEFQEEKQGLTFSAMGLEKAAVITDHQLVIFEGGVYSLDSADCHRLFNLKKMLGGAGSSRMRIPAASADLFLEKVAGGLQALGEVKISGNISAILTRTPLKAKLYLDRVKNRLLAGLEFHYEHAVINPQEDDGLFAGNMYIRDKEKEHEIMQLMEESSFSRTDEGYYLHNEALEYQFLHHILPKLQDLLQVYATTAVKNRLFKPGTPPQVRISIKRERTNWLEFSFKLDGLGEDEIRGILAAIEEKRKYYRLKGSILSLETKEMQEMGRFLAGISPEAIQGSSGRIPLIEGLNVLSRMDETAVLKYEDSFKELLQSLKTPDPGSVLIPPRFSTVLRGYQKEGFVWLKTLAGFGFGGILADDMGLGKTVQALVYIESVLDQIKNDRSPALIVCPSSLLYNWLDEMMRFMPGVKAAVMDGTPEKRMKLLGEAGRMDVIITSYPLLRKDIAWYANRSFHTVFFDEAQAFKNPGTATARAVKQITAGHRFALTGTPLENSITELWSIFHVVFPGLFADLREYSYLTPKQIARRARPFMLRRVKEDVLPELPQKIETSETQELLPAQKTLYAGYLAKLRQDTLKHLDRDTVRKNRIKILAGITRLRQICCHPGLFVDHYKGGSAKFNQLLEILEEARLAGRRVLVFSQFTKMLGMIGREAARRGMPFFYLDGETPSHERVQLCEKFNRGERNLFLISLKAGGTGLNLTGADTVVLYDTWWNPAVEEQAADRAHRYGQKSTVQVIKLIARGTIEEKMNELQEKKKQLTESILAGESRNTMALTDEDIRELLGESPPFSDPLPKGEDGERHRQTAAD
ncbi:SNF2 helicase associated domain-containing protein [Peribacillus sp. SCS-37]|uniref:SNF2 helicase associated domain-containing protein n=1 Tax=Paraperibacillus esterisolvens TaxID=3115296 RepID=UPI00390646E2